MFYRFYPHFKNLLIRSNDISHLFTSTNQEIVFDQSQFITVVFLVFFLAFSCFVSVFLGILLDWFYHLCPFLYRNYHSIQRRTEPLAVIAYFPLENVNKHGFFKILSPQSILQRHWILHIRISLGTKFQLKLTNLIFWTKFAQKGCFRSKTEKLNTNCYQFKSVKISSVHLHCKKDDKPCDSGT